MSRFDPSDRLTPEEERQACKGTLDAHWARTYRGMGSRNQNWREFRGRPDAAQCRCCGYFWVLENLEIRPNENGYLAMCLTCWIREHRPGDLPKPRPTTIGRRK